jgi:hypothetical protein
VVLVGLLDLLGVKSRTVDASSPDGAVTLQVHYAQIARARLDVPFRITVERPEVSVDMQVQGGPHCGRTGTVAVLNDAGSGLGGTQPAVRQHRYTGVGIVDVGTSETDGDAAVRSSPLGRGDPLGRSGSKGRAALALDHSPSVG